MIQLIEMKTNSLQDQLNLVRDDYKQYKENTEPVLNDLGADVASVLLAIKKM